MPRGIPAITGATTRACGFFSLLALEEATGDAALLEEAAVFTATLLDKGGFLKDGILMEKLNQSGWDTAMFKGVMARALGELRDALQTAGKHPDLSARLDKILADSMASFLKNSRGPTGEIGLQWQPGAEKQEWNYNSHLSALMAMTARLPRPPGG